jgi:hypothetical protein
LRIASFLRALGANWFRAALIAVVARDDQGLERLGHPALARSSSWGRLECSLAIRYHMTACLATLAPLLPVPGLCVLIA